jgi:hypothetical protein
MMQKLYIMALSATLAACPAHADWQFTRWGMSPDEVVRASGGAAHVVEHPSSSNNGDLFAVEGSYQAAGRSYATRFSFTNGKLTGANLMPQVDRDDSTLCLGIRDDLLTRYGVASVDSRVGPIQMVRWSDRETNNNITFFLVTFDRSCSVRYEPMQASGL